MYAAAGGASLASRQARQRQRQNKKTERLQQLKSHQKDLKPHPKQYHNYTDSVTAPKLSRVERGTLRPPPPPAGAGERRHSASNYHHLKEPSRARIRESPSISIPVVQRPRTLGHGIPSPLLLSQQQLPQILVPEGDDKPERRCSFVRQVEEMERCTEGGVLDRCNHICNFEIKDRVWESSDYERDVFGSLDYPFSECSQGRAAWQERERGRRCSLSEEARQHRIKQTEAHHRWMKRNRIHDTTYGGGSDDEDFFNAYHQSAAANALLYVGLGTTAIGSVIFFVGTGEKGFKTLELRLIGPTLIACGLLCCLVRVLLCMCPSTCLQRRRRKKTRLKPTIAAPTAALCQHAARLPRANTASTIDPKKISIAGPSAAAPSIPQIHLPADRDDSIIELQNYEPDGATSDEDDSDNDEGSAADDGAAAGAGATTTEGNAAETCLSVVIERSDNSESSDETARGRNQTKDDAESAHGADRHHSGIVLSPLQLGQ